MLDKKTIDGMSWTNDAIRADMEAAEAADKMKREALERIRKARLALYKEVLGLEIGCFVLSGTGAKRAKYRVERIETRDHGRPWVRACKKLKSGEFGTTYHNLYNYWEVVDEGEGES